MSYGYHTPDPKAYGYGVPGHPNQYGGYGPPPPAPNNGSAVAALICNIVLTVTCCGLFAVPGIITAAIAMSRTTTDPQSAARLTTISWVIFGVAIALGILLVIALFGFGLWGALEAESSTWDEPARV
ncbi:hypothetical protein LO762_00465 [Actinocorallia sp. API 0066]|uniref:hypothetical protein n=1 Tax=Actinocorallia sp. API 0066 TaxID=2896846 RepID=UPI001E47BD91|nr:hypothetical protein [Actinocorallia sp. API 0066]MCD0447676.1 hypothetical protein [Actinocorallia sp. API 0066]